AAADPHGDHLCLVLDEQRRSVGPGLRGHGPMTTTTSVTAAETARPPAHRPRAPFPWGKIVAWAVMLVFLFLTVFPFYWMLRTARSSNIALATYPEFLRPVSCKSGCFERFFGQQYVEAAILQGCSYSSINCSR